MQFRPSWQVDLFFIRNRVDSCVGHSDLVFWPDLLLGELLLRDIPFAAQIRLVLFPHPLENHCPNSHEDSEKCAGPVVEDPIDSEHQAMIAQQSEIASSGGTRSTNGSIRNRTVLTDFVRGRRIVKGTVDSEHEAEQAENGRYEEHFGVEAQPGKINCHLKETQECLSVVPRNVCFLETMFSLKTNLLAVIVSDCV